MVRRKYSEKALESVVNSGVLTREQARRANEIGRSKVDRLLETAGAGAVLGSSDQTIEGALEAELNSKGANPIASNPALVASVKKQFNLPNISGANASDLVEGVAEMNLADMDPSSAQNWKNFNQFKLGRVTGQQVIDNRVRADGTRATPDGSGQSSSSSSDPTGGARDEAAPSTGGGAEVIGGFQPVGGSPFGSGDTSTDGAGGGGAETDQGVAETAGTGSGDGSGSGTSAGTGEGTGAGKEAGSSSATATSGKTGDSSVQPDGDPEASDSDQQTYSPTAVVEHNADGSVTVHYYEPNADTLDNERTGSETYTPDGDGNYTGDQGGKLKGKPPEGNYEYDNDPNANSFRYEPEEESTPEQKADEDQEAGNPSDSDDESDRESTAGGTQGYTPNHDDGLPAATPENLAWANARQAWLEGGLKNPGNSPAQDRPDDLQQEPPTSNPRQGWAINPGPGGGTVQPTLGDWTRKFGGIGVADPPKPAIGGQDGGPQGPQGAGASPNGLGPQGGR